MDIIFDIDGTLANIEHRRHWILNNPKDWKAFQAAAKWDTVIEPIAVIARQLGSNRCANRLILCSGRGEQERPVTEHFLKKHWIPYEALYMRTEGDYRSDDIIKFELLQRIKADGFDPKLAFDDRNRVVKMWRDNGIMCCQVAEGDF
jgi:hypothetical protein